MEKIDIAIIGAGVVGLAAAFELSKIYEDIFVLEKNPGFGQGISSRNSEVIHAGIYYPKGSLKAKTCIEGRRLLYEFCARNKIGYKKTGKLIVAVDGSEVKDLEDLLGRGLGNGVSDLKLLKGHEVKALEPNVECEAAIYSPSTGIIDSHGFMKTLAEHFKDRGGQIAYNTELIEANKVQEGFELGVKDARGGTFRFIARVLINCAGLDSEKIAILVGLIKNEYKLKYCKGDYFRVRAQKAESIGRLVYPVPSKNGPGLGIHATPDLSGGLRLGPDDEFVEKIDYNIDDSKKKDFYEGVKRFLPFIEPRDLAPDISGIRPKLQGPGEGFRDFIVKEESEGGLPGLINFIGIESPGLTSALSLGGLAADLVRDRGLVKCSLQNKKIVK